jgi:hypothetical protein
MHDRIQPSRSNGLVENHNATLKNQLFHYANAKHTDWDVCVPEHDSAVI